MYSCGVATRIRITYSAWLSLSWIRTYSRLLYSQTMLFLWGSPPSLSNYLLLVVSRCLGIGPPSGIPSLGRCFCWPTISVASPHRFLVVFRSVNLQASWEYHALSLRSNIRICVVCRARRLGSRVLALTGYCQCHFCMVYDLQKGGWGGGRILLNSRAIVLLSYGQCRWGGARKE